MARATTLTPALTAAIARDLHAGDTLGAAATRNGVSPSLADEWMRLGDGEIGRDVDAEPRERSLVARFSIAVRKARAQFAERLLRDVRRVAFSSKPTPQMVARAKAAMRTLERRFPEHWGPQRERAHVNVNVEIPPGTGPQSIRIVVPWP